MILKKMMMLKMQKSPRYMKISIILSKSHVNWSYDKFYMMIRSSYINCKIELIEICPCNNAEQLKNKKMKYIIK